MKRTHATLLALTMAALLAAGCASLYPVGSAYTDVKLPVTATGQTLSSTGKVGVAQCSSWFGMVAIGDASLERAMKNGNITRVHHVDWQARNIMGVVGLYKLVVYGE